MKLYTEADMIQMYNAGCGTAFTGYGDAGIALERFTPIKLPSDEEIEQASEATYREYPSNPKDHPEWKYNQDINAPRKRKAFIKGTNWIIERIKQQADGK